MPKSLKIEEFRELINRGEATDPLIFLESVMAGQDPRQLSAVYEHVNFLNEFNNGPPSASEWVELVDLIRSQLRYKPVTLSESANAAKVLAEYIHAKRKQVEKSDIRDGGNANIEPLTDDEIRQFLEIYESEF